MSRLAWSGGGAALVEGDALEVLRKLPEVKFDAVITDPPYGLAKLRASTVSAALACWLAGEREFVPDGKGFMNHDWDRFVPPPAVWDEAFRTLKPGGYLICFAGSRTHDLMTLSIRLAGFEILDSIAWLYAQGKPASKDRLKPSFEPIIVARRPPKGSLKANIENHGTGGLNVDDARLDSGRWPPNVAMDEESAEALDEQTGTLTSGQAPEGLKRRQPERETGVYGGGKGLFNGEGPDGEVYGDSGGGSRFMFVAKAPPKERVTVDGVSHPSVKPEALMRWLVRLFVPAGGRVLDMFAGSATTGVACIKEDRTVFMVENWEPYIPLAVHRIQEAVAIQPRLTPM